MKIAIVRGDFASPWELQNFRVLSKRHVLALFTGLNPVSDLSAIDWLKIVRLPSPVDVNFGKISRSIMGILNRIFVDGHYLFGLENSLIGYDIVHCAETYYSFTQQAIRAKKMGHVKRVISTVWENIPFNNEGISGRKSYKINAIQNVDKFLAVTLGAKTALEAEGCIADKITLLRPGVNLDFFKPSPIKHKNIRILFVGRLVDEKGILPLVKIFKGISTQIRNIELVIVGDGPLMGWIKNENVTLMGNVPYKDMPKIYCSCDFLVHPAVGTKTWVEQYGMVLVEAMACGLPIVAFDTGSIKEVVGSAGLIAGENSLKTEITKLIKDTLLRKTLSLRAIKRSRTEYNSEDYSKKLEKIYEKVLSEK